MKIYQFKQHDEKDCGPACLATIFSYYGLTLPLTRVRESSRTDQDGTSLYGLAKACEEHEFLRPF